MQVGLSAAVAPISAKEPQAAAGRESRLERGAAQQRETLGVLPSAAALRASVCPAALRISQRHPAGLTSTCLSVLSSSSGRS